MTERDEAALRNALEGLDDGESVDLGQVRRRAAERRRNRRAAAGLAVALVLVAGVVGLPRLVTGGGDAPTSASGAEAGSAPQADTESRDDGDATQPEAGPPGREVAPTPTDPERGGWRTEYFRDISFAVPATWGYAVPPQSDWCADEPRGQPRADQRRPYVWLGSDLVIRTIGCPPIPASLLTEHVQAVAPGPAVDYVEGAVRQGDWWVVTRFAGSAVLVVTTQDQARAEQILDSVRVDPVNAPCPSRSAVTQEPDTRPDNVTDLAGLPVVERAVLCQYEPTDPTLPTLRASVALDRQSAQALVEEFIAAPVNDGCGPGPDIGPAHEVAILVRLWTGSEVYEVYVDPAGCPDGGPGMSGGIDDGTTVRVLTRSACSVLLTPPVALWSASGDVGRNCLG